MNPVAAIFRRIQQSVLQLPCNQLSRSLVFERRGAVVRNQGYLGLGKDDNLDVHAAMTSWCAAQRGRVSRFTCDLSQGNPSFPSSGLLKACLWGHPCCLAIKSIRGKNGFRETSKLLKYRFLFCIKEFRPVSVPRIE